MNITRSNIESAVNMTPAEFAEAGHKLVDSISQFLADLPQMNVTTAEKPSSIRAVLGDEGLPQNGAPATKLVTEAAELLFNHSLFNGHPNFWGYITSSATPIGALGDLLAATVNPNVGAYTLSPIATEIERQTVRWLAEMIGYNTNCGGLFVSGGNMANFIGFLVARKAMAGWDIRKEGLNDKPFVIYCSQGTHTWIQKAADLFGFGTNSIRWIDMNDNQQMDVVKLEEQIKSDIAKGFSPFIVVGTAGSVSTGAVDSLADISRVCKKYKLWFHVDGAYGAPAALLPEYAHAFKGLSAANSIAIDPHKWLYAPLEAGCVLIRDEKLLHDTFSFHPEYYNFDGDAKETTINYFDFGLQNSRGFRALKVWLALKQVGKNGYQKLMRHDIEMAEHLYQLALQEKELDAVSRHLSITTFRYAPSHLPEPALNELNEKLLNRLQAGGKVYLSNAIVDGKYCLRACVVNFRTNYNNIEKLVEVVLAEGRLLSPPAARASRQS